MDERSPDAVSLGSPGVLRRIPARILPLVLVLGLAAVGVYFRDRTSDREAGRQAAWGVVQLQAGGLDHELESLSSTIVTLAEETALLAFLSGEATSADIAAHYRRFCQVQHRIEALLVLDLEGRPRLHVSAPGSPDAERAAPGSWDELETADRAAFQAAVGFLSGQVYISPFALKAPAGPLDDRSRATLRFSASIHDERGAPQGVLVMTYLARNLVSRISQAALYATGSIFLVDERGFYLEGSKDGKTWGFAPGHTFAQDHAEAWRVLAPQNFGSFMTAEGMFTFRTVAPQSPVGLPGKNELRVKVVSFLPEVALYAESERTLRLLLVGAGIVLLVGTALAWRLSFLAAQKEKRERELADSERRLRLLSNKLLDAQEAERRSLSRDLHDDVGQLATSITIDLKRAERAPAAAEKDALLRRAQEGAARLLESTHRIVGRVRTGDLEDLGLKAALESHVAEFEQRAGLATELELELDDAEVPAHVAIHVYRIVQEALSNVLRHAQARRVSVRVSVFDDTLLLEITDDGRGFDPRAVPSDHWGLLGMRERVGLLGGSYRLASAPGQGTRIEAKLPLEDGGLPR